MNGASGLDIETAIAHLSAVDPVLATLVTRSLPRPRPPEKSLFHVLVSAMVSQQISGRASDAIMRRVCALVAPDGELSPELVLAQDHEALRAAGLSNQKVRYILGLAQMIQSGELELARLPELDDEAVIAELTRVKGIGRWTAEMFLLFSLGRPNVLSVGDLGIRTAMMRAYRLDALPGPEQMHAIAARWHPHCSGALLLLWHSLDNAPTASLTGETFVAASSC